MGNNQFLLNDGQQRLLYFLRMILGGRQVVSILFSSRNVLHCLPTMPFGQLSLPHLLAPL